MSMGTPDTPVNPDSEEEFEEDAEEISIEVTDDGEVCVIGSDFEFCLDPEGARLLAQALMDAADDAEGPTE